jgi:cytochrome c553
MNRIAAVVFAVTLLAPGRLMLTGQEAAKPSVFTAAQAEAGRTSYENSCGKCHAYSLLGRTGQEGELPPVSGLPAAYQEFISKVRSSPSLCRQNLPKPLGAKNRGRTHSAVSSHRQ